jgi:hypothetical protein
MAKIPSLWDRDLPLHLFVDTPMHLLFLGVAKAVFILIGEWASRRGRSKAFRKIATEQLGDLEKLKLQWLSFHVKTFDTWGGWVSEKYQSLSRVALWIYGPLLALDDVPEFVEPKDRTVDQWLVEHYRKWLKVRGLPQNGSKEELKAKVVAEMAKPIEQRTPLLPPKYGDANGVMMVLRSMVVMFTTLLQPSVDGDAHSRILSLRIRLFLNYVVAVEKPLHRKKKNSKISGKKQSRNTQEQMGNQELLVTQESTIQDSQPYWLSHFNFLSLLNLPEILREFGSMRNYFEGKYLGERYVQEVKNARRQCGARNVTESVLRKLHEGKAIEAVVANQSSKVKSYRMTEVGNQKKKQLTGNVRIYRTEDDARVSFLSRKPISVLQSMKNEFGLLFYKNGSNRGEINFLKILQSVEEVSVHQGMRYWRWNLTETILEFDDWEVRDFAVLLPKSGSLTTGEIDGYTVVTKEWSPLMLEHYEYSSVGIKPEIETKQYPIMSYVDGNFVVTGWEERRVGEMESTEFM